MTSVSILLSSKGAASPVWTVSFCMISPGMDRPNSRRKASAQPIAMIRPTEIEQDLASVLAAIDPVRDLLRERGQLSVTSRPGAKEPLIDALGWLPEDAQEADYSAINEEFRGGAVEQLIQKLDFQYGRIRLMRLAPKSCLSVHADSTRRYHYAILTTPDCYLVEIHG